jgi:FkbM family methyltransferase
MTFYSQFKQDKILEEMVFKGYKNGVFVDVGAHNGKSINNTLYFEENHNWSGINIEPIKSVYDELVVNRPKSINLNIAVCDTEGELEFIQNIGYTEMISGLKQTYHPTHLERLNTELKFCGGKSHVILVETKRLETVFDENDVSHVNFLSIDVEGAEFQVIKSINFDKVFIDTICFEDNYQDSHPIINYLIEKGYKILHIGVGDIFMIHKNSVFNN